MPDLAVSLGFVLLGACGVAWSSRRPTAPGARLARGLGCLSLVIEVDVLLGAIIGKDLVSLLTSIGGGIICISWYRRNPKAPDAGIYHGLGWFCLGGGSMLLILEIAVFIGKRVQSGS